MNKFKKISIMLFIIFLAISIINIRVLASDNFDFGEFENGSKAGNVTNIVNKRFKYDPEMKFKTKMTSE